MVVHRNEGGVHVRRRWSVSVAVLGCAGLLAAMGAAAAAAPAAPAAAGGLSPQAVNVRQIPGVITAHHHASTACVPPDGTDVSWFPRYPPDAIRAPYVVKSVAPLSA